MPQTTKLVVVVFFYVIVLAVTGCGAAGGGRAEGNQPQREQQGDSPQDKPVSGLFVGKVPSTDAFFAVVADKPKGRGGEREVSAYLSDGRQLSEGFTTTTDANRIRISSQNKMNLVATISPSSTTGTITPGKGDASEGASYRFDIPPATDVDGYYPVMVPQGEGSKRHLLVRSATQRNEKWPEDQRGNYPPGRWRGEALTLEVIRPDPTGRGEPLDSPPRRDRAPKDKGGEADVD